MKEVAIIGFGLHPWGKFPDMSWDDLAVYAAERALKDAHVEWKDIQLICGGEDRFSGNQGILAGSTLHARLGPTGIPTVNCYNACATGGYALKTAQSYINSGFCDLVLVVAGSVSPKGFFGPTQIREFDPTDFDTQRFRILGQTNPTGFAQQAVRRMQLYGLTEDDIAEVKVKNSRQASANPYTRYRKIYTKEEVLNSPLVCYPLRLFEICATSDGGAALVVCSMEKAKQYTTKPVIVASIGVASPDYYAPESPRGGFGMNIDKPDPSRKDRLTPPARAAYEEAGIGPEDIDMAEVYDLAASLELYWYEATGLCKEGEAEALLREGATRLGGRIPVNTSGGVSSSGEAIPAQAMFQICEHVQQLRGIAGERQVEGAKVGLAINRGLGGNSSCIITKI